MIAWLVGCGNKDGATPPEPLDQDPVAVLESFSFGWDFFNHRLSHLEVHADPDGARVSIIGGTSTTREVPPELPAECTSACDEFPFVDTSAVTVGARVLQSDTVALLPAEVTFTVGRDGAEGTLSAELPDGVSGPAAALLSGLVLDTDHEPSGGPSCYDPRYGWHPSRWQLALGAATVSGGTVEAPVSAAFAAGNTHDGDRVCVDEINEQALVTVTVQAVLLVGPGVATDDAAFVQSADYPYSGITSDPGEQEVPADEVVSWALGDDPVAVGLSSMEWVLYPDVYGTGDAEQGAYLRTLAFGAEPSGAVRGTVTNYSPGTQLEGLSYDFHGEARAVAFDGDGTGFTVQATLETLLDGTLPVVHELPR